MTRATNDTGGNGAELLPQEEAHLRAAFGALGDPHGAEMADAELLERVLAAAKKASFQDDFKSEAPSSAERSDNVVPFFRRTSKSSGARSGTRRGVAAIFAGFALAAALAAFAAQQLGLLGTAAPPAPPLSPPEAIPSGAHVRTPSAKPTEAAPSASDTTTTAPEAAPEPSAAAEPEGPAKASSSAPPHEPSPSADELLKRAQDQYTSGNTAGAAAAYRALVARYPGSAEARAALISLGQLALRGGRPGEALADFDRYLAGGGPLAIEARVGRISALRSLGRTADERAAISDFLARHGSSVHAARLQARLTEISSP